MSFTRTVDLHCPSCKVHIGSIDTAVGGPNRPYPGDPSICGTCGVVCVYTETMGLKIAEQRDIDKLSSRKRKAVEEMLKTFGHFRQGAESCRVQ